MEEVRDIIPTKTINSTPVSTNSQTTRHSASAEISLDHITPERKKLWVQILKEAYSFLGREDMVGNRLKMAIRTFDGLCQQIPTQHLYKTFELSLGLTDYNGVPIFWDGRAILLSWSQNAEDLRSNDARQLSTTPRINCPDCFGNSTGRKIKPGEGVGEICLHENDPGDSEEFANNDFNFEEII